MNGIKQFLSVSDEVCAAVETGKPVVALESTIISHGMPYPKNVETALNVERIVRENGAVPATVCILYVILARDNEELDLSPLEAEMKKL